MRMSPVVALAAAAVGCAAFAYTPVDLSWKFEGYVAPDAVDGKASAAVAAMELGAFASDEALPTGADEFVFRSWGLGAGEAGVIKRYPQPGLFIYIR